MSDKLISIISDSTQTKIFNHIEFDINR